MNTRSHAVTDTSGRPISIFITAGPFLDDVFIARRAAGQKLNRFNGFAGQFARYGMCARGIGDMMPIGFAKPCQIGAQGPASLVASHARKSLDTTSAVTKHRNRIERVACHHRVVQFKG
jgi:hypothetical protein